MLVSWLTKNHSHLKKTEYSSLFQTLSEFQWTGIIFTALTPYILGLKDWPKEIQVRSLNSLNGLLCYVSDVMKLNVMGVTEEGRKIVSVHIGAKSSTLKPAIFIEGGIHAREWISPATVTFFIKELVTNPRYFSKLHFFIDTSKDIQMM